MVISGHLLLKRAKRNQSNKQELLFAIKYKSTQACVEEFSLMCDATFKFERKKKKYLLNLRNKKSPYAKTKAQISCASLHG